MQVLLTLGRTVGAAGMFHLCLDPCRLLRNPTASSERRWVNSRRIMSCQYKLNKLDGAEKYTYEISHGVEGGHLQFLQLKINMFNPFCLGSISYCRKPELHEIFAPT